MGSKAKTILIFFTIFVVGVYFFFWGLVQAKAFLAPLSVAVLLAMVVLPVTHWFEKKGLNRALASLFSDLIILLFFILLGWVLVSQVRNLAQDWPQIRQTVEGRINQVEQIIQDKIGPLTSNKTSAGQVQNSSSPQPNSLAESAGSGQQQGQPSLDVFSLGSPGSGSSMISSAGSYAMSFLSLLGTFLLIFVYVFFFLLYRDKFRKSAIKMVSEDKREDAQEVISKTINVSQNYLFGRLILIAILAVLYSIGLSITGVNHAILISILAAVLSLIPYIGNIIGYALAVGMAFFSGSGVTGALGVTATFVFAQFVESYILEPYIVGDKVNINPVFTIIAVVLGGAVWGVVGMILAIPALGIAKVLFDQIPALNPLGYLFGDEDIGDKEENENLFQKVKLWFQNKFS